MKWIMCYVIAVCIAVTVFAATVAPLPFNIFFIVLIPPFVGLFVIFIKEPWV